MAYFNQFDWRVMKGQYVSVRVTKDWDIPSRIGITKRDIYAAFNNEENYNPYVEFTERGSREVIQNKSKLTKNQLNSSRKVAGGRRKRRTRKKIKI